VTRIYILNISSSCYVYSHLHVIGLFSAVYIVISFLSKESAEKRIIRKNKAEPDSFLVEAGRK